MFLLNYEFVRLSYFGKIRTTGWTNRQTDRRTDGVQQLMRPVWVYHMIVRSAAYYNRTKQLKTLESTIVKILLNSRTS